MLSAFYPSADGHFHLWTKASGADEGDGAGQLFIGDHAGETDQGRHGERGTEDRSADRLSLLCGELPDRLFYGQRQLPGNRADYSGGIEAIYSGADAGELWTEGLKNFPRYAIILPVCDMQTVIAGIWGRDRCSRHYTAW